MYGKNSEMDQFWMQLNERDILTVGNFIKIERMKNSKAFDFFIFLDRSKN